MFWLKEKRDKKLLPSPKESEFMWLPEPPLEPAPAAAADDDDDDDDEVLLRSFGDDFVEIRPVAENGKGIIELKAVSLAALAAPPALCSDE